MAEYSRKEHIKLEAAKLFRKKGFNATSMQDIAEAVGMRAASLYNHISSKQEILSELLDAISNAYVFGMNEIQDSTLEAPEKLEALIDLHVDMTVRFKNSMALVTGEWVHLEDKARKEYIKKRDSYEKAFLQILEECKKADLIHQNTHIELALYSILSTLHWLYSWYTKRQNISRIELSKQLKQILIKGILN